MLETRVRPLPGSITVETCVCANRKFSAILNYGLSAYFYRLCLAVRLFFVKSASLLHSQKSRVKFLLVQVTLFLIFRAVVGIFIDKNDCSVFFFIFFSFHMILITIIRFCIASGAKPSFASVFIIDKFNISKFLYP